jgi:hypothetical protein
MKETRRTEDQPHDRLTELAGVMIAALESEPGTDDVQSIILLSEGRAAGVVIHGYDDDAQMLAHLASHMEAVFSAHGLAVSFHSVDDPTMN